MYIKFINGNNALFDQKTLKINKNGKHKSEQIGSQNNQRK